MTNHSLLLFHYSDTTTIPTLTLKYKNFPLQNVFYISHDYGAPILSLPETNVNWNLTYQSSIFMSLLHNTWRTSAYSFSKAPKDFLSQYQPGGTATIVCNDWVQYQPGGTATIVCNDWVSRVFDIGEDHLALGWWSFVTLQGKGQKKITIVMAYNASLILGDTTNFHQQQWVLTTLHVAHNQRVDSQPRRQFMLDLQAWLEHIIQDNHEVILSMDANTTYDPDTRHSSHPVIFKTGVPTVNKKQDGTPSTTPQSETIPPFTYKRFRKDRLYTGHPCSATYGTGFQMHVTSLSVY